MDKIFYIPQEIDTPPTIELYPPIGLRYLYTRSSDSRQWDAAGQDFLIFRRYQNHFSFALCDGVSQSFMGDLAARSLGYALIQWLDQITLSQPLESVANELTVFLTDLAHETHPSIQNFTLPSELPPMLIDALEAKREKGSESVFICGMLALPSTLIPYGCLLLAWMGDSRFRFWGANHERTSELGDSFHTEQRWSSKKGPVNGEPHIFMTPLENDKHERTVLRCLTYSDGLASLDDIEEPLSSLLLSHTIHQGLNSAQSDDMSYLEIWLDGIPPYLKPSAVSD